MDTEFRGFFPGSKKPLPEQPVKKKTVKQSGPWDARPVKKVVRGEEVEFFLIGAVCAVFNRPPVTIRLWIRKGFLPQAPFKLPDKNGIKGRRLYRREHIESLIRVAEKHGIIDNPRIDWSKHTTFASDVRREWISLADGWKK